MDIDETRQAPTLAELYPNLTPDELAEAEENLKRYLQLVLRIFDRIESARKTEH